MNFPRITYNSIVGILKNLHFYDARNTMYLSYVEKYAEKANVIVDAGCGSGNFSRALENQQRKIISIDLDLSALKSFKGMNSERICADAQTLPLCSNSIDCVLSISVIEHIHEPSKYAKEISRIIKNNGIVIVQLPNLQYFFEPHSKWPLLFLFPRSIQTKILTALNYAYINMNITIKKALTLFSKEDLICSKYFKLYHSRVMQLLPLAPSYILIFKKTVSF